MKKTHWVRCERYIKLQTWLGCHAADGHLGAQVYIFLSLWCRFIHVPGCIIVGVMGLVVEIPLYTAIAILKSPYMLFKGWYRLIHDLISREGPFLETACIPIAGLTILLWPLVVIGSIIMAIFSSFFIGLYGAVVVYQVNIYLCHFHPHS